MMSGWYEKPTAKMVVDYQIDDDYEAPIRKVNMNDEELPHPPRSKSQVEALTMCYNIEEDLNHIIDKIADFHETKKHFPIEYTTALTIVHTALEHLVSIM